MADGAGAVLAREARLLVERLRLWTPSRWAAAAGQWGSRGDLAHHLASAIAAQGRTAEGLPPLALPRLDDLVLADQLAVVCDDLLQAGPGQDVLAAAAGHLVLHRAHLLAEELPAGLGGLVAAGRQACLPHR